MLKHWFFWGGKQGGQQLGELSFWQRKRSIRARLPGDYLEHTSNYKGRRKFCTSDFCMQMFLILTVFSVCAAKWMKNEVTVKKLERMRGCHAHQLWVTRSLEEISLRDAGWSWCCQIRSWREKARNVDICPRGFTMKDCRGIQASDIWYRGVLQRWL